jgi:hypothetical protein
VIDFRNVKAGPEPEDDDRPRNSQGKLLTARQVRSRARRQLFRGGKVSDEDFEVWAGKPIDEWDLEELARGRTRDAKGGFRGKPPSFMPRAVMERIQSRYKMLLKGQLDQQATTAIGVIEHLLRNQEVDDKGKPLVPAATKLDAAKWLVEHVVGKPVQPTTTDVSVKLQGILGAVMVNPVMDDDHPDIRALPRGYSAAHFGVRGAATPDADVLDVDGEWDDDE